MATEGGSSQEPPSDDDPKCCKTGGLKPAVQVSPGEQLRPTRVCFRCGRMPAACRLPSNCESPERGPLRALPMMLPMCLDGPSGRLARELPVAPALLIRRELAQTRSFVTFRVLGRIQPSSGGPGILAPKPADLALAGYLPLRRERRSINGNRDPQECRRN